MPPPQAQMPPPPPPPLLRQHGELPFPIRDELLSPSLSLDTSAGRLLLSAAAVVCRSFLCRPCFRWWLRLLRGGDDPVSIPGRSPLPPPKLLFLAPGEETDVAASTATAVRALKSQPVSEVELTPGGPRRMNSEEAAAVCCRHGPPPAVPFPLSLVERSHAGSAAAMPSPPLGQRGRSSVPWLLAAFSCRRDEEGQQINFGVFGDPVSLSPLSVLPPASKWSRSSWRVTGCSNDGADDALVTGAGADCGLENGY